MKISQCIWMCHDGTKKTSLAPKDKAGGGRVRGTQNDSRTGGCDGDCLWVFERRLRGSALVRTGGVANGDQGRWTDVGTCEGSLGGESLPRRLEADVLVSLPVGLLVLCAVVEEEMTGQPSR